MTRSLRFITRKLACDPDHIDAEIPALVRRVLAGRGVHQIADCQPSLKELFKPEGLNGFDLALKLLEKAYDKQWSVLIAGDYDADGATATALCVRALTAMGFNNVRFQVPDRFVQGYGLSRAFVQSIVDKPDLIITVDNGIASLDGVAEAKKAGIRVLVTDHHLPGEILPQADAIINPNVNSDDFPSRNLAGVGVAFYLMAALRSHLVAQSKIDTQLCESASNWLDLVALGTVADIVSLDRNNRILVAAGLQRIRGGRACPGIMALLKVARREHQLCETSDLGFAIGPRLNAAGRMDDMHVGISCLLSASMADAERYAWQLDQLNLQRRSIQDEMESEARLIVDKLEQQLPSEKQALGVVLFQEHWHEGVVGLVASRMKDRLNRPVAAFASGEDGLLKGSARSIKQVHIRDVLALVDAQHPGAIERFGGHAMAAGLSLKYENLPVFKKAFESAVAQVLDFKTPENILETDGELSQAEFSLPLAKQLSNLAPWGQGFPAPSFHGWFKVINHYVVGEKHLKMVLVPEGSAQEIDAIAFGKAGIEVSSRQDILIAYALECNYFRGRETLQIRVIDWIIES
ncbi:MAG: single-stranded-DNA-specific exonuclease RecJ [bacterium]